ncbi:MAG: hypothetical protein KGY57_05355 [Gammaproteobacteria bacterium]|nr:hypothetical protein [Gammaproteobacteria bacterium]
MSRLSIDSVLPVSDISQKLHSGEDSRAGVRQRLRREVSHVIRVDNSLQAAGFSLTARTRALEMPWLDALFNTPECINTWLMPRSMADGAFEKLNEIGTYQHRKAPVASEVALMEAIQHQRAVLRIANDQHERNLVAVRRRELSWAKLRSLLAAWEITLRA